MLQTFCATLVMIMAIAETTVLMQWSRQANLWAPAIGVESAQDVAHIPTPIRS